MLDPWKRWSMHSAGGVFVLFDTDVFLTLLSGNAKHFKPIHGLRLKIFSP
jgi:hypothetical protein